MGTVAKDENIIIELSDVTLGYGAGTVLKGINLYVKRGEIVALVGPNGVGKSTLMHAIIGLLTNTSGYIKFNGQTINGMPTQKIIRLGITLVPEGKLLFSVMTVLDNLILGTYHLPRKDKRKVEEELNSIFTLFPILKERRKKLAEILSGGEQQMLAISRGLMGRPQMLLLDEPLIGLSPLLSRELMNSLLRLRNERGISILLSEQNVVAALEIADRGYVLGHGIIALEGSSAELQSSEAVKAAYLGKEVRVWSEVKSGRKEDSENG